MDIRCISHEIRNQISICELYAQIIKKNIENENIKNESIDNALKCITRSLKLINNQLVDLKSMDNFDPATYEIQEILKEGINLAMIYIQDKDIEISLSCPKKAYVYIDENKFLACIVNIIKNAIEAIEEKGEIHILCDTINEIVSIKISNNGTPIPANKNIFEKGVTTKKSGSGLGLAICQENLKIMNADLKLNKSTPKLTEFEITLPEKT